jgi:class 3 adenylate cyclase
MQPAGEGPRLKRQEVEMLRLVHAQERSWRALAPVLLPGPSAVSEFARAPLPELSAAGRAAGFVNFEADADGALRSVEAARSVRGGRALQLGIAAAVLHLRVPLAEVAVDGGSLRVGGTTLPLDGGNLWLDWPTPGRSAGGEADPPWLRCAPRFSLGGVLDVAKTERDLQAQRQRRDELATEIASAFARPVEGDALLEAVREEARFRLEDAAAAAATRALSEEEERELAPFRRFADFERVVSEGAASLAAARAEMEAALRGRLVFVGWTATGAASDFVPTPLSPRTPGVVAHAVAADMVMTGRALRFAPPSSGPLLALLLGAIATAACFLPAMPSLAVVLAALAGHAALAVLLFGRQELVLPLMAPLSAGALAWVGGTALEAALAQRDQLRITRQFKARVAPELVDWLGEHPDALSMAGEAREVTAFFVDLAGFTSLSEQLGPHATVALLNRCMSATTEALTRHGAYVNKYLGDGVMAFWSAFRPDPEQATRACRAALATLRALAEVVDRARVSARIGLASGRVIVGDCGAPPRLHDYTAIGDAINLASRLESANKQFGTAILVDGRTREQSADAELRFRPCGRVVVVGQSTPVDLFELAPPEMPAAQIELTARAVEAFRAARASDGEASLRRRLEESRDLFRRLDSEFGPSRLARVYVDAIEGALARPALEFDGVLHLTAK